MRTAAVRYVDEVQDCYIQETRSHGGVIMCKMSRTKLFVLMNRATFQLIAESLRPPAEFRKHEFDRRDANRVLNWLPRKKMYVRCEIHESQPDMVEYRGEIIGAAE